MVGLLFHATPTLSLFANAGVGYETPTFSELAYRRDGRSGLNADLRAARSENYEIGLRSQGESMRLSAAAFESRTHDELVVADNAGGRSSYGNAGLSRRRGVELSLSAQARTAGMSPRPTPCSTRATCVMFAPKPVAVACRR